MIEVRKVRKRFGALTAVDGVDLTVQAGELTALLGPSGCGKTTLLRIIAGLEQAEEGGVYFQGVDAASRSPQERQIGFVFQHYALFRHMSVFENIAFGLRVRPRAQRPSGEEIQSKVQELLKLIQLENMAQRYPAQLSGGQRQRVALARALAVEPKVLLLDEPFGALDARVRKDLRRWLRRLHDELHVTSLFVTHDQEEALEVADRVVVMNAGRVEQVGTPEELYARPANAFVYNFLGDVNLFHCRVHGGEARLDGRTAPSGQEGLRGVAYVRPHLLELEREPSGREHFRARVTHVNAAGPLVKVELVSDAGAPIQVSLSQERYGALRLKEADQVFVTPKEMRMFEADYAI